MPVYGLYHGGERSLPILQRVLNDCECRGITFPDLASLQIPLRSSSTGSFVDVKQGADAGQLLELALRSILIDAVQWQATWKNITQIALNVDLYVEILAIGPISRSLLPLRHTVDTSSRARVKILDSLGNEARNETIMDTLEYKDSIAIVGMSVNFPIGSDKDTFWESLQNGLNVVQEVRSSKRMHNLTYLHRRKVPNLRFDVSSYPGDSTLKAARHGNFLAKPWEFDHEFFKLSPREVKSMDPQVSIPWNMKLLRQSLTPFLTSNGCCFKLQCELLTMLDILLIQRQLSREAVWVVTLVLLRTITGITYGTISMFTTPRVSLSGETMTVLLAIKLYIVHEGAGPANIDQEH